MFRTERLSFRAASPRQLYFEHELIRRGIPYRRHDSKQDVIFSAWVHYVVGEGYQDEANALYEQVVNTPEHELQQDYIPISEEELAEIAAADTTPEAAPAYDAQAARAEHTRGQRAQAEGERSLRWLYVWLGLLGAAAFVRLVFALLEYSQP